MVSIIINISVGERNVLESWPPCCHRYCCSVVVTVAAAVAYVMTVVHVIGGRGREVATGVVLSWRG